MSWSNVRDKLNIGLFDAAHLLAPAIAFSVGIGHVKVRVAAPFNLGINDNAIMVSPALHAAITGYLALFDVKHARSNIGHYGSKLISWAFCIEKRHELGSN